jgi:hypothetical protein
MKMQGIVHDNGLSFSQASVVAFLLAATVNIQPLQHYLVDNDEWFLAPDTNGIYVAASGAKYALKKMSDYATVKVGGTTKQLTRGANVIEFSDGNGTIAVMEDGIVSFDFVTTGASQGKVLTANGNGGYTYETVQGYTGSTSDTAVVSVVNGVVGSSVKVDTAASNNILTQGVNGLSVGLAGNDTATITMAYDYGSHTMSANLRVDAVDANNRLTLGSNGLVVKPYVVGANSTAFMTINQATGEVDVTARTIVTQHTVTTGELNGGTGAAWLAANAATYQEGDLIQIPTEGTAWVKTATSAFEQVLVPSLTDAAIRSKFSATSGVALDQNTGAITGVVDPATTGLSVSATGFAFNYANVAVTDATGISGQGVNYATVLGSYLTTIAGYAQKMFDKTASEYFLTGNGTTLRFYVDTDGAPAVSTHTGAGSIPNL